MPDSSVVPAGPGRRRRYDATFKQQIVEQTLVPGASVARIAREHGINANQLFKWRRQHLAAMATTAPRIADATSWLPVMVSPESTRAMLPVGQIAITLAGGQVTVSGAVDAATLRVVLSSLRR